jgi:3-hydroxybutyryl-CoA dehydrogenase
MRDISIVGAGVMGHGLAAQFARQGARVTLIDHRQSNLDRAEQQIGDVITFLNEESLTNLSTNNVLDRIEFTLDTVTGVADTEIVIETVSEDLEVKQKMFETVAAAAPDDTVLASNTSGIPPTKLADAVPEVADRIVVCHWWNPPYLMPPVEVVPGEETSDATIEQTTAIIAAVDRNPIVLKREIPGFVWNRIQFAVVRECMYLLEEDIASLEDIDAAVRDGYALRTAVVGPFQTMDLGGLELFRKIANDLYPELCDDEGPSELFDNYISQGRSGIQGGAGFYKYDDSETTVLNRRNSRIAALHRALGEDRL